MPDARMMTRSSTPSSSLAANAIAPPIEMAPPNSAPPMKPMPPSTVWTTTWIEANTLNCAKRTVRLRNASRMPPRPAIAADEAEGVELGADDADAERRRGPLVRRAPRRAAGPARPRRRFATTSAAIVNITMQNVA